MIAQQKDENKKFAPERSWGKVKTAFNVYFANYLKMSRADYYKLIVKDLLRPDSQLKNILSESGNLQTDQRKRSKEKVRAF